MPRLLTGSQAKTAFALRMNAQDMLKGALKSGAFLTLTVGDKRTCAEIGCLGCKKEFHFVQVKDAKEASRRINNVNRRLLPLLFERAIIVTERHKSGAIHFHILGVLNGRPDIRTGLDFEAIARRDYRTASEELRNIWTLLRDKLPEYGFGRAELLPIKKTGDAVASYVSKYVEKNVCNRTPDDKRKKLVRYLGWNKAQLKPNEFAWATPKAVAWRAKARAMGALIGVNTDDAGIRFDKDKKPYKVETEASRAFGSRWAFELTRIWRSTLGDDLKNGFSWNFGEQELLRAELYNLNPSWARKADARKLLFSYETRLCKVTWPEYFDSQLRPKQPQLN